MLVCLHPHYASSIFQHYLLVENYFLIFHLKLSLLLTNLFQTDSLIDTCRHRYYPLK